MDISQYIETIIEEIREHIDGLNSVLLAFEKDRTDRGVNRRGDFGRIRAKDFSGFSSFDRLRRALG